MDYHFPHQAKDPHNRRPRTPQQQPLLVAPVPTRALPNYSQFLSASPPPMSSPPLRSASPNPSTSSGGRSSHSPKPLRGRPRPLSFHSQLSGSSSTASPPDALGLAPPGAGAPQPMKSTGSGSTEWHGTDYFGLQRVPSPVPSSSGLWTSRSSAAIKRTASLNSFLSSKVPTDSGNSNAANMRSGLRYHVRSLAEDSDYFNQDTSPTTLTKTPTYEYYGFVLYLGSFIAFGIYLLWAFLPDEILQSLGITYYPSRYWALAVPVWTFMLIAFICVTFIAFSMMNTAPFDSFTAITDEHANIVSNLAHNAHHLSDDFIPELQDIPIGVVNAVLYQDLSELLDDDEEDEWEAERERERMGMGAEGSEWEEDEPEAGGIMTMISAGYRVF